MVTPSSWVIRLRKCVINEKFSAQCVVEKMRCGTRNLSSSWFSGYIESCKKNKDIRWICLWTATSIEHNIKHWPKGSVEKSQQKFAEGERESWRGRGIYKKKKLFCSQAVVMAHTINPAKSLGSKRYWLELIKFI